MARASISGWDHQKVGQAINKIRVVKDESGTSVFGIGVEVIKLELPVVK